MGDHGDVKGFRLNAEAMRGYEGISQGLKPTLRGGVSARAEARAYHKGKNNGGNVIAVNQSFIR